MTTAAVNMTLSASVERAVANACVEHSTNVVKTLAQTYGFDLEEAMAALSLDKMTVVRSVKKSQSVSVSSPKKTKSDRAIPKMVLPFCSVVADWCEGLRLNHSLYTQCTNAKVASGDFCVTCQTQADANANGKPKWGTVQDRLSVDMLEYVDPAGKKVVAYANVMAKETKLGLTREAAVAEAARFGWMIPEVQFELQVKQRGRPKSVSASESSSDSEKPKVRGRPRKEKSVGAATNVGDDLLAAIAAEADSEKSERESMGEADKESKKVERSISKENKKAEKAAAALKEKDNKKLAAAAERAAEREAKKLAADEAREAKKAAAAAEKLAKKSAGKKPVGKKSVSASSSDDEAAPADDTKLLSDKEFLTWVAPLRQNAAKASSSASPSPAPVVVAAIAPAPVVVSELELSAESEDEEESNEESDEEEPLILVTRKYKNVSYAVDAATNKIYDMETEEVIGCWNPDTKKPELD